MKNKLKLSEVQVKYLNKNTIPRLWKNVERYLEPLVKSGDIELDFDGSYIEYNDEDFELQRYVDVGIQVFLKRNESIPYVIHFHDKTAYNDHPLLDVDELTYLGKALGRDIKTTELPKVPIVPKVVTVRYDTDEFREGALWALEKIKSYMRKEVHLLESDEHNRFFIRKEYIDSLSDLIKFD